MDWALLLNLFITFFKIGLFTFGGGYAMIPLVTEEATAQFGLSEETVMNFIAVCESTPGPIAINMATFIGSSQHGVVGAIVATLGVVLPSFIIILLIVTLVKQLFKFKPVQAVLGGIRPVVVGLIIGTGVTMILSTIFSISTVYKPTSFDWKALVVFAVIASVYYGVNKWKKKTLSPIILILISAVLGIIFYGLI